MDSMVVEILKWDTISFAKIGAVCVESGGGGGEWKTFVEPK